MRLVFLPKLSNDAIFEVILWSAVAAALAPLSHAVLRSESRPQGRTSGAPTSTGLGPGRGDLLVHKGLQDRFRTAGAFYLAVLVAAFTYVFSDDPADAVPGLKTAEELWIWSLVNVAALITFAAICNDEARRGNPESGALRLFWVLEAFSWGAIIIVRADGLASDGLAKSPLGPASLCFYGLACLAAGVGGSYALFNAQTRFPAKRRPSPLRSPPRVRAAVQVDGFEPVLGGARGGSIGGGGGGGVEDEDDDINAFVDADYFKGSLGDPLLPSRSDPPLNANSGGLGSRVEAGLAVSDRENPEVYAGPLSLAYFAWVTPLVVLGFKRPLEQGDLTKLHPSDNPDGLSRKFQAEWAREVAKQGGGGGGGGAQSGGWGSKPSLFRALARAFGRDYAVGVVCKFVYDGQQFVGPLLLQRLITFLGERDGEKNGSTPPMRVGYELVLLLAGNALTQSVILHQYFHRAFRTGMRLKAAIISALYGKSLKVKAGAAEMTRDKATALDGTKGIDKKKQEAGPALATEAKEDSTAEAVVATNEAEAGADMQTKKKTTGEVVNLMAVDAQRLQDTMAYIAMLWSGLFQIAVSLWYLSDLLGVSVLAGVCVMVLSVPATSKLSVMSRQLQKRVMNIKDSRIKVENEVLGGMKIIKLYAWEGPFMDKVDEIRRRELAALWDYQCLQMGSRVLWSAVPTLVSISSFSAFTLLGNELTAATAFTSLALFNLLRFPLATLPWAIASVVECTLSLDRIQSFLLSPEVRPLPPLKTHVSDGGGGGGGEGYTIGSPLTYEEPTLPSARPGGENFQSGAADSDALGDSGRRNVEASSLLSPPRLELRDAHLAWDDGTTLLAGVTISVRDRELCAVVGSTGSGKSGLLLTIIGELEPSVPGSVFSRGSIAYVSQVAWIQNASLKDNVLFGKALDPARYARVVEACCLTADLEMLPSGDATEIGEKGINLSGGQKQRVSMARAVYADADLYLLDDCLSAVDAQVTQHIFWRCIKAPDLLGPKAVVLVTHNLQLLAHCDTVVLLDCKTCPFVGPFEAFLRQPHDLAARCLTASREEEVAPARYAAAVEADKAEESVTIISEKVVDKAKGSTRVDAAFANESEDAASSSESAAATGVEGGIPSGDKEGSSINTQGESGLDSSKLIETEGMARGAVSLATYRLYVEACGSSAVLVGVFGGLLLNNVVSAGGSWWLGYWADHTTDNEDGNEGGNDYDDAGVVVSALLGLGLYSGLCVGAVAASFVSIFAATASGQRACKRFHERLLRGVVRAPMSFFDTTPLGRVMNRFSKDVYTLDEQLPNTMYSWLSTALACCVAVGAVAFVVPWFLAACVPMGYVYYRIMVLYIPTSRELQRLESVTRSPVFSHFGETLEGASTIRAFRAEGSFVGGATVKLERNLRSYYANVSSNRWLALRLEAIGTCFVTIAAALAVVEAGHVSAGAGGLALTYALNITQTLNWYVRMSSDRESQVVAVERLAEYATLQPEAPAVVEARRPPPRWPSRGAIMIERCAMRYRPGLPLVLRGASGRGIDLSINPGEKVGVVGRTGAGKSSLLLVLLRLVEPEPGARLVIDGEDVLTMGLYDLRRSISIIPQDPVLFTGTVRFNLDPFNAHLDDVVWSALDRALLGAHVRGLPGRLTTEVEEGGRNFSMGERQLLCLARALLRASRILLLDEATSAVDHHTDALIQTAIRTEFAGCTVLTIAHRLDTVIDYDRVLVLSDGAVVEDGTPATLLGMQEKGVFKAMWEAHLQKGSR